ncbi:DUF2726 domain-containing protein [Halomonas sp. AOP13-D3-9]
MLDVNILSALPPLLFTFVIGIIALKFLELFFWEKAWQSFFNAFLKGVKDDSVSGKNKKKGSSKNRRKEPEVKEAGMNSESLSEMLLRQGGAYSGNDFLMSPTERDVYKVLERAYGDKYYIFAQVRVVDVLKPNARKYHTWTKEYKALFRQVSQWHFDYVMCHKEDFRIYCVLELDDTSHERPDRQRRDRILNAVCKDSKVRLERLCINHANKKIEVIKGEEYGVRDKNYI